MDQITIVVPCFNEEEVLRQFHQRVNEVLSAIEDCSFRLLFINDGSRDSTLSMIQQWQKRIRRYPISVFQKFWKRVGYAGRAGLCRWGCCHYHGC